MRPRISSGHAAWLHLTVGAGLTSALLTAFRRLALLLMLIAATVVPTFGNSPAVAGSTAAAVIRSAAAATRFISRPTSVTFPSGTARPTTSVCAERLLDVSILDGFARLVLQH